MPDISRRSLAAGAGLLVGAMAFQAKGQQQQAAAAASAKVRAQPLTFNPEKIKWLSPKSIIGHHEIYAGSVNRLNATAEQLAQLDVAKVPPAEIAALKREQQAAYNSSILHEIYFECIGEAPTQPSGVFAQALSRDFGSLDRWKAEFAAIGKAQTDGKGLVILAYTPRDKRLVNHLAADHATGPTGCVPLITLDMYEHAYQPDYGSDAAKYVDTFVQMMRWITAERLYREAIRV